MTKRFLTTFVVSGTPHYEGSLKYKKKKVLYFETAELFELKLFKNNG
jgi:hypothetical protein